MAHPRASIRYRVEYQVEELESNHSPDIGEWFLGTAEMEDIERSCVGDWSFEDQLDDYKCEYDGWDCGSLEVEHWEDLDWRDGDLYVGFHDFYSYDWYWEDEYTGFPDIEADSDYPGCQEEDSYSYEDWYWEELDEEDRLSLLLEESLRQKRHSHSSPNKWCRWVIMDRERVDNKTRSWKEHRRSQWKG